MCTTAPTVGLDQREGPRESLGNGGDHNEGEEEEPRQGDRETDRKRMRRRKCALSRENERAGRWREAGGGVRHRLLQIAILL